MAAYKVINLDNPIESDYWVDIPVRDPATNKDAVDEEGRILVERHVTRSVKNEEMSTINTAVETVNTLKEDYSTFKEEFSTKVNSHDSNILTNTNNITTLTESVNNHDLQINALYSKINAIQGIDIDDFKLVTESDIKDIRAKYLPLTGGTISGSLTVSEPITGNIIGNLTGKADSAKQADTDNTGTELTSYVHSISGSNDTISVTLGNGTSQSITINNVANANIANSASLDSNGDVIADTYSKSVNGITPDEKGNIILDIDSSGKNLVRSINGISANTRGDVQLGYIGIVGEIKWFVFNKAPDGFLICDGAEVSRATYADLFAVIGTTFGAGDGSTTFALPNLINKFVQGSTTVGTYKSAGLPNITGTIIPNSGADDMIGGTCSGAFYRLSYGTAGAEAGDYRQNAKTGIGIDASKSNAIYGNSETVQPPALTLLPCIKY